MKTVLTTELKVERFAAFAELGWLERRPELGLVCTRALQGGRRFTPAVVQSALPGVADAGAKNIIAWCELLGLCDKNGALTTLGEQVASTGEAPVPEQGVYGFWATQHPLLGNRILHVERMKSTPDLRFEAIQSPPIKPDERQTFLSVADAQQKILFRGFPSSHGQPGAAIGATEARCRLEWSLNFAAGTERWTLKGSLEKNLPVQHAGQPAGLDLKMLADTWGQRELARYGRWLVAEQRLAVPFAELSDTEQESFQKTFTLAEVQIFDKGSYKNVRIDEVPISPASPSDAQSWATARLDRLLKNQPASRSRSELRRNFLELTEGTPLERYQPSLGAHDMVVAGYRNQPAVYWALAAPVDLAPQPPTSDELATFRMGEASISLATDPPNTLIVPYRAGWSMRQLLERLLAGELPRRCLLVDRYVRGEENLGSLRLLAETLKGFGAVTLEVLTGQEEGADMARIQQITGQRPRSYAESFGRSPPHDRYLLVATASGAALSWQLSNSPLDARCDGPANATTPLRWRGLTAVRLAPDQLPDVLERWLVGGAK